MKFKEKTVKFIKKLNLWFGKFCTEKNWQKTEITLIVLLLISMGSGLFAQVVLANDELSQNIYLGENWYGEEYETAALENDENIIWGNVVLELADFSTLSQAKVLVNDEEVADFTEKEVAIRVEGGDVIAVDTSAYNCPVKIRVKKVSSVIDTDTLAEETIVNGFREIGEIRIR